MGKNREKQGYVAIFLLPCHRDRRLHPLFMGRNWKQDPWQHSEKTSILYTHSQYFVWLLIALMLKERERGRKEGGGAGRLFSEYVDKVSPVD